jgi:hypothetical protein
VTALRALPKKPVFPLARLVVQAAVTALAVIGGVEWFGTPEHFGAKVEIFLLIVGLSVAVVVAPYCYRLLKFVWEAVKLVPTVDERIRVERANTWRAVQTNSRFANVEISMLRMKLSGTGVRVLLNVGELQAVQAGQQFEIVAVPDMETYGVVTVAEPGDENSWCELEPNEGQPGFMEQMRERLKKGDLLPPAGYQARPFMADSYRHVLESSIAQTGAIGSQTAFTEGGR